MRKVLYVQHIGDSKDDIQTFNGTCVFLEKWDIAECSERNAKNACRMYPKLYKIVDKPTEKKVDKKEVKKVEVKKSLSKKSK